MRRIDKPAFFGKSFRLFALEPQCLARSLLMLNKCPIIVQPSVRPHLSPCEEFCTVVFRLPSGRSAMGWFIAELSQHFEGSGTAAIVKFEVGDHLRNQH
nr:hypothetical protein [uncultured Pseudomonas sp.]